MPEQETAGRQPEWALMYALRRDLDAPLAARARTSDELAPSWPSF